MKDDDIIRIARGWPELTLGALRKLLAKYGLRIVHAPELVENSGILVADDER